MPIGTYLFCAAKKKTTLKTYKSYSSEETILFVINCYQYWHHHNVMSLTFQYVITCTVLDDKTVYMLHEDYRFVIFTPTFQCVYYQSQVYFITTALAVLLMPQWCLNNADNALMFSILINYNDEEIPQMSIISLYIATSKQAMVQLTATVSK